MRKHGRLLHADPPKECCVACGKPLHGDGVEYGSGKAHERCAQEAEKAYKEWAEGTSGGRP